QTDVAGNVGAASTAFLFTLDTIAPALVTLSDVVPNVRSTSVTSIDVTFSEAISLTSLTFADLILSRDGSANLINAGSGVAIAQDGIDPTLYRITLPAPLTSTSGGYSLKVVGAAIADLAGNASSGNVVATWTMNATSTAAPGTPSLLSPIGVINDVTPTFSWTATSLAARYDLWVNNLSTGASQVIRQTSLVSTTFTPSANLAYGSYRVWVRALNGSDVASSWSTSADFRIGAPTVTAPTGTTGSATPAITWTAVDAAAKYDLWVDSLTTGASQVIRQTNISGGSPTFTPTNPLAVGAYRVWVRAIDATGASTAWSVASDFSVGIPSITGPIGTASSTPTISWTNTGATNYDLWVDNLTTGASQVIRQTISGTNSFTASTLPSGTYRAWVRAFDAQNVATPWSAASDFRIGIPTVTAPIGSISTTFPTFTWSTIAGTSRYDLWVDNLTTGSSQAIRQTNLTTSSFTPATPLAAGSTYRVWVRAFNAQNVASQWSPFADFMISNVI
ncbi:MAG: hypothetical protein K2X38_04170, partial [Gemmataceae bacterium]|nr:hypothetical protein [Gemmataceae bacterium]